MATGHCLAETFSVTDRDDHEIEVTRWPVTGTPVGLRVIWLSALDTSDKNHLRPFHILQQAGIELWTANPLESRFQTRSAETLRTFGGAPTEALIRAADEVWKAPFLIVGHERMGLQILRGIREWQADQPPSSAFLGAVLLYPNLFGPTPIAGQPPSPEPITSATNVPLVILQPNRGALRRRIIDQIGPLWSAGSATYLLAVPDVRDWYVFREPNEDPAADRALAGLPGILHTAADLLASQSIPKQPVSLGSPVKIARTSARGIIPVREILPAEDFLLKDARSINHSLSDYRGRVTLVNFWATWCPPCVEEIPSMNRLAGRYGANDFEIVSINFQETGEHVREFMRRVAVDFPVLLDLDGQVAADWQVFAFPSSFLLDRSGRIRYSVNNAIAWDEEEAIEVIDQLIEESSVAAFPGSNVVESKRHSEKIN